MSLITHNSNGNCHDDDDSGDLGRILNRKRAVQIELKSATFDYGHWTQALECNRTLEKVTMAVSLRALGRNQIIQKFFQAVGNLPQLQTLEFRGGIFYHWRFPWSLLNCMLANIGEQQQQQQQQQSIITSSPGFSSLHIQDVEFFSSNNVTEDTVEIDEITELANCVSSLPSSFKHFTMAHCRLATETRHPVLDPLLGVILTSRHLEKVIISATRPNALGGPLSKHLLRDIFAREPSMLHTTNLQELRLLQFHFTADLLASFLGTLLRYFHLRLETLLLSSCHWDLTSLRVLAHFLRHASSLRELQLLGDRAYLLDDKHQECHCELAEALSSSSSSSLRKFIMEPLYRNSPRQIARVDGRQKPEEEELSDKAQQAYVKMIQNHYDLEEFRMVQQFSPERQGLIEFYLRLNRAGRRTVCFSVDDNDEQPQHGNNQDVAREESSSTGDVDNDNKEAWMNAIIAVNDDVTCIFYFLSMNPSLCNTPAPSLAG